MVVIGIDFGSESCIVSAVQGNSVVVVNNDYFERKTPTFVAFTDKERLTGVDAKNQLESNLANTVSQFKGFLNQNDRKEFQVQYLNEAEKFTTTQVTSMLLAKLKSDAEAFLEVEVTGCVIAVPAYFTTLGATAMGTAAKIAGFQSPSIIKETTAVAINYGYFKKFTQPKIVAFVDIGHSATQVFICSFSENELKMICEESKPIGGRHLNSCLARHFMKMLNAKQKDKLLQLRFEEELDELKRKMSLDTIDFSLRVEDTDGNTFHSSISRNQMEEICSDWFFEVENTLKSCFFQSNISIEDINAVEIVGGSSRIPKVKEIITKVFGQSPKSTMNQDEAVSQGCIKKYSMLRKNLNFMIEEKEFPSDNSENSLTAEELDELMKTERKIEEKNKLELERNLARNNLEAFITKFQTEFKSQAQVDENLSEIISSLEKYKNCPDSTTEEYNEALKEINLEYIVQKASQNQPKTVQIEKQNPHKIRYKPKYEHSEKKPYQKKPENSSHLKSSELPLTQARENGPTFHENTSELKNFDTHNTDDVASMSFQDEKENVDDEFLNKFENLRISNSIAIVDNLERPVKVELPKTSTGDNKHNQKTNNNRKNQQHVLDPQTSRTDRGKHENFANQNRPNNQKNQKKHQNSSRNRRTAEVPQVRIPIEENRKDESRSSQSFGETRRRPEETGMYRKNRSSKFFCSIS